MASEIQICNLALSRLGGYRIQSFNDSSKEARECALHYPLMRDSVLEDHDWDFARKRILVALLYETYTGWAYAYQYPTDCLTIRKILGEADTVNGISFDEETSTPKLGQAEYEVISSATLNRRIILTDKADAELVYTARVTDPNMFSSLYIDAAAWRLASDLAIPLKGKPDLQATLVKFYMGTLAKAKASASNQSFEKPDVSFVEARR